ncbi:MAG: glycosyltransferase involved in cell wall biosynthesis [Alteromonas naphthalenivorans]|jgi:glycosyltransferase involved in cell wall biosynthesis
MKKLISIVVPVYNEQETLFLLHEQLQQAVMKIKEHYEWEIVFVNDGSRDDSWKIIQGFTKQDTKIKGISFSRNFGHQMALAAGYDVAQGDAIITLDADLQDPPGLIFEMLKQWEAGYYIVYARRTARNDGWLKDTVAHVYYKLLHAIAEVRIPRNVGDFRLIDKKVLQAISSSQEPTRYWRGLVAWTGYKHTFIDFDRQERVAGDPGYTWAKSFKLGFDGLTGFSFFPLEIAAYIGAFVIVTGAFMFGYITYDAIFYETRYPLFKWLTTIIYIFTGVQFLLTWLVGEYIGRMYMQQKQRPLYIVEQITGEYKNESYAHQNWNTQSCNCSVSNHRRISS